MIIAVTGYKRSGKDSIGDHLMHQHGFRKMSFAYEIKAATAILLGIRQEDTDLYKEDEGFQICIGHFDDQGDKIIPDSSTLTMRTFQQRFGTEVGRQRWWEDFWIDLAFKHINPDHGDYVITDLRYENEADRIREIGGSVWRVIRGDGTSTDPHSSEAHQHKIRADVTLHNNDTLEKLYESVDWALGVTKRAETSTS